MSELSLGIGQLSKFSAALENLLKDAPELRRNMHTELANEIEKELGVSISSSLNDGNGTVKGWQGAHVGSGGGYAAVRPNKGTAHPPYPHTIGRVTAALERGHQPPKPGQRGNSGAKYRPRIKLGFIPGRFFYQKTYNTIETKAVAKAEQFVEQLKRRLEV